MGLTARIYPITAQAYAVAATGVSDKLAISAAAGVVDLDKAWHAIHHLLTGNSTLTFLLSGTPVQGVSEHCEVHSPAAIKTLP